MLLGTMLNADSPLPLYHQLADRLAGSIDAGRYGLGQRIPSEHALAERYGIGRPTVRQATELLVRRGLLERRRGAGTFVTARPRAVDAFPIAGTTASFGRRGVESHTRIVTGVCGVAVPPDADNPFAGRLAHFLSRVTETAQGPALLEETYLDPELFGGLEALDLEGASLAAVLRERYRSEPSGGRQELSAVAVDGERARLLGLTPGAPVLLARRHLDFPRGRSAVYAELFHRSDRVVLTEQLGQG